MWRLTLNVLSILFLMVCLFNYFLQVFLAEFILGFLRSFLGIDI